MSFSPHFLVILRHLLSSLFFVSQPKVLSVAGNSHPELMSFSTMERAQTSVGQVLPLGSMGLSNKVFLEGKCVSFAFMKFT